MLRIILKLTFTDSSAIQDFVKFENHELIRIGLIYYWILSTSVTNEFRKAVFRSKIDDTKKLSYIY